MEKTSPNLSKYCYRSSVQRMMEMGKEAWLAQMEQNYPRVHPKPLDRSAREAWADEYDVLCGAFRELPEQYRKLQIIFEFVMPAKSRADPDDPTCRADAVLLSRDTVTVFEFKRHEGHVPRFDRQARKYAKRLRRYHTGSVGMKKHTVMVPTRGHDVWEPCYRLLVCSPDRLAEAIRLKAGSGKLPNQAVKQWLSAEWRFEEESQTETRN